MQRSFVLEYWQEDGWFIGRLREVPGVFSQGETLDELIENVRDAYQMMMADESDALPESVETSELVIQI